MTKNMAYIKKQSRKRMENVQIVKMTNINGLLKIIMTILNYMNIFLTMYQVPLSPLKPP